MKIGTAFLLTFLILIGLVWACGSLFSENADNLQDLEQAREQVLQLQQQLAEQEAQHQGLAGTLEQSQATLDQTTAERDAALKNNRALTEQVAALAGQVQGLQAELQRLQVELAIQQARTTGRETQVRVATGREQANASGAILLPNEQANLEKQLAGVNPAGQPLIAGLRALDLEGLEGLIIGLILTLANLLILGIVLLSFLYTRVTPARPGLRIIRQ